MPLSDVLRLIGRTVDGLPRLINLFKKILILELRRLSFYTTRALFAGR